VLAHVQDAANPDDVGLDGVVHGVRKPAQEKFAQLPVDEGEGGGKLAKQGEVAVERRFELRPQPRAPALVPLVGGAHIGGRLRPKGDAIAHGTRLRVGSQRGAHLVPIQIGAGGRLVEPALELSAVVLG
jgi:hypothetical protein